MKPLKKFLLLSALEPHPDYPLPEPLEAYLERLFSLSRFFPNFHVKWEMWNFHEFAEKTGKEMQHFDMIFVSGSPWNVDDNRFWMNDLKELLKNFFEEKKHPPIFGICFGLQFLTEFFGGKVENLPEKRKGVAEFLCHGHIMKAWVNHRQGVTSLPKTAKILAEHENVPAIVRFSDTIWGFQPHFERMQGDPTTEKILTEFFSSFFLSKKIATEKILDTEIDIFFNNSHLRHLSFRYSYDDFGKYLGIKYQCVELVRRFIYLKTGKNLAEIWQEGNACHWFDHAENMHLKRIFETNEVQEGDILCFSGGGFLQDGHVAIVEQVLENGIFVLHQNGFDDEKDFRKFLPFSDFSFQNFLFQGALRF